MSNQLGGIVARTNSFVELATGLHYVNPKSGEWEESNPGFQLTEAGYAVAPHCQHQVVVSPNLNPEDGVVVDLRTPDGQRLRSGVIGLNLFDPESGQSRQVAAVRDVAGTLVSSNEIVWLDAFEGLRGDVRVRNERGEFHQDVLLRERLTPAQLRELGFDASTARLEVWTEFHEAPPPAILTAVVQRETNATMRARMVEPDLVDQRLDFGVMRMDLDSGKAFAEPVLENAARVLKEWQEIGGRRFLIESSSYEELAPLLESLPVKTASLNLESRSAHLAANRTPPTRTEPGTKAGKPAIKLAKGDAVDANGAKLVLDYVLINQGLPGYTFKGDTTYYVSAPVTSSGATVFEGGAVLKYAANASLTLSSSATLDWQGQPYRPVILTAKDDNIVGQTLPGSTGYPGFGAYANPALKLIGSSSSLTTWNLAGFRIAYAQQAIIASGTSFYIWLKDGQLVNCANGLCDFGQGEAFLRNLLFANVQTPVKTPSFVNFFIEHTTFAGPTGYPVTPGFLVTGNAWNYPFSLKLTNCILARITSFNTFGSQGSVSGDHNGFWNNSALPFGTAPITCPADQNPFQTVGAGSYYLADTTPSLRDAGTALINPDLALALKSKTTSPPTEITENITSDTVLPPLAIEDTNTPDLGYHYDPLDWAVNYITVSAGVTLTLQSGVAVGFYGGLAGFQLDSGARLESNGQPAQHVSLARYAGVQEQPVWWARAGSQNGGAYIWGQPTAACQVTLNGTDIYLAGTKPGQDYLASVTGSGLVNLSHCQMFGGRLSLMPYYQMQLDVQLFNLFWRTTVNIEDAQSPWRAVNLTAYNNLFYRGYLGLQHNYYTPWVTKDNAFDGVGLTAGGSAWAYGGGNSHNGYINTPSLPASTGGDVSLTSFAYQNGPAGVFYQQSADFTNQGSRSALAAGLFHHTVNQAQQKEATSTVDIGYHYVAMDTNGIPFDTDGDGIADYFEDRNGNGTYESSTDLSNWQNSDTDGDGMPDGWMMIYFGHPLASADDESRAQDDPDADGLTNLQEKQLGKNPTQGDPPVLSSRPAGRLLEAGNDATYSVVPLSASASYQWYIGAWWGGVPFAAIHGATNSAYTRTNVQLSDNGHVRVDVYNAFGHTYSIAALVVPDDAAWTVWTNYTAHTNSKSIDLWSAPITHPTGWPNVSPLMAWNTNCLLYGMAGFTGISQCNEFEGYSGQVAVTAITRRHGYMRGHGNGNGGYQGSYHRGHKVWFCAADNTVITATVYSSFVRCFLPECGTNNNADYGLVLFDQDLDSRIQPVTVMTIPSHLVVVFSPCQHGKMRANVPPFLPKLRTGYDDPGLQAFSFNEHDTFVPGDSGSPDLIPVPEAGGSTSLVMIQGRSTWGPSQQMETDLKTLIDNYNSEKGLHPGDYGYLDPANPDYKLNWHSYP